MPKWGELNAEKISVAPKLIPAVECIETGSV
jgi:hypothetical protein